MTWNRALAVPAIYDRVAARWFAPGARARRNAKRRAERDARRLHAHPTARLLLAIDPRLTDDDLERGIARARARGVAWLRGWV